MKNRHPVAICERLSRRIVVKLQRIGWAAADSGGGFQGRSRFFLPTRDETSRRVWQPRPSNPPASFPACAGHFRTHARTPSDDAPADRAGRFHRLGCRDSTLARPGARSPRLHTFPTPSNGVWKKRCLSSENTRLEGVARALWQVQGRRFGRASRRSPETLHRRMQDSRVAGCASAGGFIGPVGLAGAHAPANRAGRIASPPGALRRLAARIQVGHNPPESPIQGPRSCQDPKSRIARGFCLLLHGSPRLNSPSRFLAGPPSDRARHAFEGFKALPTGSKRLARGGMRWDSWVE